MGTLIQGMHIYLFNFLVCTIEFYELSYFFLHIDFL